MSDHYSTGHQQPGYGYSYPQQSPDPYAPHQPTRPKSKALGIWALSLAVLAIVLGLVASIWMGSAVAPYATTTGMSYEFTTDTMPTDVAASVMFSSLIFVGASVLGVAAIILSIIGMVKNAGRALSIFALIIALVAPIVCTFVIGAAAVAGV